MPARMPCSTAMEAGSSVMVVRELAEWADDWDRLVEHGELAPPFLRSWWLGAVAPAGALFALVARDDALIGGLALQIDDWHGIERVRLLGDGPLCPDHLDLVCAPGEHEAVTAALAKWLGRPGNRVIDLAGVAEASSVRTALPGPVRAEVVSNAPFVDLLIGRDRYEAGLAGRVRSSLHRNSRRLERLGARSRHHRDPVQGLADFTRLHVKRWGTESGLAGQFDAFAAAVTRGAERGEAVFHDLRVGDQAVACEVTFEVAGRSSFYQSGRDMDRRFNGAGTVLKAAVLDDCRRRGVREYDLLRGDEPYKQDWATGERLVLRLRAATGARARAVLVAALATDAVRRRARRAHDARAGR